MFGLGPWEFFIIFLAILLLFGAKRLPEIAQGMGKGIREFKKALHETSDELKMASEDKPGNTDSVSRNDKESEKS